MHRCCRRTARLSDSQTDSLTDSGSLLSISFFSRDSVSSINQDLHSCLRSLRRSLPPAPRMQHLLHHDTLTHSLVPAQGNHSLSADRTASLIQVLNPFGKRTTNKKKIKEYMLAPVAPESAIPDFWSLAGSDECDAEAAGRHFHPSSLFWLPLINRF